MIDYLPPLQALRAFEAAARNLSYSLAARELGLTHGAISHHVARLERDLGGIRLFVRDGQTMLPTEQAQVLALQIRQGLQALAKAFADAQARGKRPTAQKLVTVSVLPGFASHWLVPRLLRFQGAHPGIDIALRPTAALTRLDGRDGIDLAIRYGPGGWAGLKEMPLLNSVVFPVCSPAYREAHRLRTPADLETLTLLRNPRQLWRPWFAAAGLDWPEPAHGPSYEDAGLLLQAAMDGQGVALARSALLGDALAAGRLVQPFAIEAEDAYRWFIVWREPLHCDPVAFGAFLSWLVAEAASGCAVS